jgi:hypothetical protein
VLLAEGDATGQGAEFASRATNSFGVRLPRLDCGRTSLMTFALTRERDHSRLKHSSRNLPLKLAATPFCQDLACSINAVPMPCATIHDSSALDAGNPDIGIHFLPSRWISASWSGTRVMSSADPRVRGKNHTRRCPEVRKAQRRSHRRFNNTPASAGQHSLSGHQVQFFRWIAEKDSNRSA